MTPAYGSAFHGRLPVGESREWRLHARVAGEFREMPGLMLTLAQASRLFGLDADRCEHVLDTLVQQGLLVREGQIWRGAR